MISEKLSFWQKKTKKEKREILINISLIFVVVFLAFGAVPLLKIILNTNYPLVVVSSESMVPTINKGDILIIKWKDPADIEVGSHTERTGDVLLYETTGLWDFPADYPVVHRVVGREYNNETGEYAFITQGDANSRTDPPSFPEEIPVPEDHIIGVVAGRIPKLGYIKIWMEGIQGLSVFLLIGLGILLIISIVSDIVNPEKKESKENNLDKSTNDPEIGEDIHENEKSPPES